MKLPSKSEIARALVFLRGVFAVRFNKKPVASVPELVDFVQTRAAYVGQTALYGYLKTRMGIRYPKVFEDSTFAESIDIAKWWIYAACVSDLSIFAAATVAAGGRLEDADAASLARHCYRAVVADAFAEDRLQAIVQEAGERFDTRLNWVAWAEAAVAENAFAASPAELIRWAPIADELKQFDAEIVTNSIRFRWRDIREQLRGRVDAAAVVAHWRETQRGAAAVARPAGA